MNFITDAIDQRSVGVVELRRVVSAVLRVTRQTEPVGGSLILVMVFSQIGLMRVDRSVAMAMRF